MTTSLPVHSSRLPDGRWRARLVDAPEVEAFGMTKDEAVTALRGLMRLLRGNGKREGRVC